MTTQRPLVAPFGDVVYLTLAEINDATRDHAERDAALLRLLADENDDNAITAGSYGSGYATGRADAFREAADLRLDEPWTRDRGTYVPIERS